MSKGKKLIVLGGIFIFFYFIPFENNVIAGAVQEAFLMLSEYVREHVLFCLIPAFFIAGAIMVFLNQQAVIKYLGPDAKKITAYSVASVSGAILAVCSCTVLPIFKGIYKKGAGIGPAVSFLYSGPAINILAIVLTAKVLGWQLGVARAVGAVVFAFVIGFCMHLIFRKEDEERITDTRMFRNSNQAEDRSIGQTVIHLISLIGILIFLNWPRPRGEFLLWEWIYRLKYIIGLGFGSLLIYSLISWFKKGEIKEWTLSTRDFALQIVPLLFIGVLIAGFLLGRPGQSALIPSVWIERLVGGNSLGANFFASVAGALMYFATLTEVPIMEGLLGAGMGDGPALALLLAGPSLSLPSIIVINSELGIKKTSVYILLVVILSAAAGMIYGSII